MNFKNEIKTKILDSGFSEVTFLREKEAEYTIIIAAFPYQTKEKQIIYGAKISPFAQKNHYAEAVNRLKKTALFIREKASLNKKDIRIFCNSQLEEKWFAAISGLGFYGRNSLIITQKAGSRIILAGIKLPLSFIPDEGINKGTIPGALCGNCHKCITACPTSAIEGKGSINRDKCLQSLTTDDRILSESIMERWGNRLYGCSICQDCCPYNSKPSFKRTNNEIKGNLGESVQYEKILTADDSDLKEYFRGTALSMSWIDFDLLRRNAIISAASEEKRELLNLITPFINHKKIGYAARWSIKKITAQLNIDPAISAAKSPNSIILPQWD